MTVKEAIEKANILRPNDVPDELKVDELLRLDMEYADFMDSDCYQDGENTVLIVPEPYSALYVSFTMAFIDSAQEDSALYANDSSAFANDEARFKAWYGRNFRRKGANWRVGL